MAGEAIDNSGGFAQPENGLATSRFNESLDFCPVSPLFLCCRRISPQNELIVGPSYADIHHEDVVPTNAPGFVLGYRRFFWRTMPAGCRLMPQWDRYFTFPPLFFLGVRF
jgi:hypothetical protein